MVAGSGWGWGWGWLRAELRKREHGADSLVRGLMKKAVPFLGRPTLKAGLRLGPTCDIVGQSWARSLCLLLPLSPSAPHLLLLALPPLPGPGCTASPEGFSDPPLPCPAPRGIPPPLRLLHSCVRSLTHPGNNSGTGPSANCVGTQRWPCSGETDSEAKPQHCLKPTMHEHSFKEKEFLVDPGVASSHLP